MTHQDLEGIVNRYDRQERISGWNQEKLEKAKVVVVGNDIMANYCAITLAAFGFGSIELYGPGFVTKDTLSNFKKNNAQHDYSDGFLY
ncbi:hypothetical protein KY317_00835, partial [Candidatus Woesearchaeota archaeon]|nr:hypothetical protein [Candidatus Woesearchaeota archaeon]